MKKNVMRSGLLIATLCFCMSAFSLTLGEAKEQGLVGEQTNGMLGVVKEPSSEVTALVKVINGKRKAAYQDIAQRNGTDVGSVQKLAGKKAIAKTPAGQFIQSGGQWQQVQ
jgi:uncharacterized protein